MMKMVMAIVPRDEAARVLEALVSVGLTATFSESRGGVLRQAQQTLFIAVNQGDLESVLTIIRGSSRSTMDIQPSASGDQFSLGTQPVTTETGGAIVFIWDLDRVEAL